MRICVTCKTEQPLRMFALLSRAKRKRLYKIGYEAAANERYLQCDNCRVHPTKRERGIQLAKDFPL